jgi:vitamin K-dependent gamma-carboxylase
MAHSRPSKQEAKNRLAPSGGEPARLIHAIERGLFAPTTIAPLVYFRILFGAIMLWEVARYYTHDWIGRYYLDPIFFFQYFGFSWVQPLPGSLMYVHFLALGILATFILLGLWYRVSAALFFLGFTYVFLIDQANYLNHFYLVSWVSLLMIFVPAHRAASLDAARRPDLRVATTPAWPLWLLRAMVGIAYFFGGIAKLNRDWLQGEPMREWLAAQWHLPLVGSFLIEPWAPYLFSYGGLMFDLLVVPLLLWRRTRALAVVMIVSFHLTNVELFQIGIFPWFMLLATPIFFDPKRLLPVLRFEKIFAVLTPTKATLTTPDRYKPVVMILLGLLAAFHVFMPLRHHLYPGNVSWTEEGHYFSWHMKLRSKGGALDLIAAIPDTGETWTVDQSRYLTSRQRIKMLGRPDMIVLFSHFLAEELRQEGHRDVEIRAEARISLNSR